MIATGNAKDNNAKVWLLLRCSKGEKEGRKGEGRGLARAAQGSWCRANGNGSALSKVVAVVGLCFVIARGNGTSKAI